MNRKFLFGTKFHVWMGNYFAVMKLFSSVESATDGVDEQEETEVQITAAVMDITGDSDDLEEEAAGTHDDDYSSYELDDSDTAAMGVYYRLITIFLFSGLRGVHVNRPGSSRPRSLRTDTYSFCT